jgi:hypothetical protein
MNFIYHFEMVYQIISIPPVLDNKKLTMIISIVGLCALSRPQQSRLGKEMLG